MEKLVWDAIRIQIQVAVNFEKLLKRMRKEGGWFRVQRELEQKEKKLILDISRLREKRRILYENYCGGALNEEEYLYAKDSYDTKYEELTEALASISAEKVKNAEALSDDSKWIHQMKRLCLAKKMTSGMVSHTIERIDVFPDQSIKLTLKYQDIFEIVEKHGFNVCMGGTNE